MTPALAPPITRKSPWLLAAVAALVVLLPSLAAADTGSSSPTQMPAGLVVVIDETLLEARPGDGVEVEGRVVNGRDVTDYVTVGREHLKGAGDDVVDVAVVSHDTAVGAGLSLPFTVTAHVRPDAPPGTVVDIVVFAQSEKDPGVYGQATLVLVVEPQLTFAIDPSPLMRMAGPGEEVEFGVKVSVAAQANFAVPLKLEALSHEAFVTLDQSEWWLFPGMERTTTLRVRVPTAVVEGTTLDTILRASARGTEATAQADVAVIVNSSHRLTLDIGPLQAAVPGQVLPVVLTASNVGGIAAHLVAPHAAREPGGWQVGPSTVIGDGGVLAPGATAVYGFDLTVGNQSQPGFHRLSLCLCAPLGYTPVVPLVVEVVRVFELAVEPIRNLSVTGAGELATFDFTIRLRGNEPGEVRLDLEAAPGPLVPRVVLLAPHDGSPAGTPWKFPRTMEPGETFRLRVEVPLPDDQPPGEYAWRLLAGGPEGEAASMDLWLAVGAANLKVAALLVDDERPDPGQAVRVTVRILNTGASPAEPFVVVLYDNGEAVATGTVRRVAPQEDTVVVFGWDAAPGAHNLSVRIDPPTAVEPWWGAVAETDEADNGAFRVLSIEGSGGGGVEVLLVVAAVGAAPAGAFALTRRAGGRPRAATRSFDPWVRR